jgi:hypothetical protein
MSSKFGRFSSSDARKKAGMNTPQPSRPGRDGKPTERNQMPVRWLVLVLTCTLMSEWPPLPAH